MSDDRSVKIELASGTVIQAENGSLFTEATEHRQQEFFAPKTEQVNPGTFGWAIEHLKKGERLTRRGWNGKRQYIEIATCISYTNARGTIINVRHNDIGSKAIAFIGTSGIQLGWLASQSDMLAEDWELFV